MRTLRFAAAGLMLAAGLTLVFQQGLAQDKADKAGKKAYNLVLTVVKVKATTADGKAWDVNDGKPDLVVRIKNLTDTSAKEFVSEEKTDTFSARYDQAAMLVVEGQRIQVEVIDKDAVDNDLIGRTSIEVTKEILTRGAADIGFGQVESLKLEFRTP